MAFPGGVRGYGVGLFSLSYFPYVSFFLLATSPISSSGHLRVLCDQSNIIHYLNIVIEHLLRAWHWALGDIPL